MNNFNKITPFEFYCQKVIPLIYDDSLSYYEVLCKLKQLLNQVIESQNALIDAFNNLIKWVDGQIEIYTKQQLQEWLDDGTFKDIINEQIFNELNIKVDSKVDKISPLLNTTEKDVIKVINSLNDTSIPLNNVIGNFETAIPFGANYYANLETGEWDTIVFGNIVDLAVSYGMDCITLLPFTFLTNYNDNNIITFYDKDQSLIECIQLAKSKGLKVNLKCHIVPKDKVWQKYVDPSDPSIFFPNLIEFEKHYARIAEQYGCEIFCIGEENSILSAKYREYWVQLINAVRSVFNGKITYGCNFATATDEQTTCVFLDQLDIIGLDNYTPISVGLKTPYSLAKEMCGEIVYNRVMNVYNTYKKPIMFTEFGFGKWGGGCLIPNGENVWDYTPSNQRDLEMYNGMKATLDVFKNKDWFVGFWYWSEKQTNNAGNALSILNTPSVRNLIKEYKEG